MPRPCKHRRVCAMPEHRHFGPRGGGPQPPIQMTVDEFEAIRLIDLAGLSQEACAQQMGVARTTAQAIYNSAREKLARSLVDGRELVITGGHYVLCGENAGCCSGRRCCSGSQCPKETK